VGNRANCSTGSPRRRHTTSRRGEAHGFFEGLAGANPFGDRIVVFRTRSWPRLPVRSPKSGLSPSEPCKWPARWTQTREGTHGRGAKHVPASSFERRSCLADPDSERSLRGVRSRLEREAAGPEPGAIRRRLTRD